MGGADKGEAGARSGRQYKMKDKIDWDAIENEGRAKILWLTRYEVLDIFVSEMTEINLFTRIDLPENWRVHEVYYSAARRSFGFIVFSDEFPATEKYVKLPDLEHEKVKHVLVKGQ